jgi:glycosyltransferase involved in cell wall biosynthesis
MSTTRPSKTDLDISDIMTEEKHTASATGTDETTVAINIPIEPGEPGGVQQFSAGLIKSLGEIETPQLRFVLVTHPDYPRWIKRYASERREIVPREGLTPDHPRLRSLVDTAKQFARPILKRQRITNRARGEPTLPDADGFFEALGADVVHFPIPLYERTELPTIFNPHDLQHLHYPENFSEKHLKERTKRYRIGCEQSVAVDVPSQFVKNDVVKHYDVEPESVHVIPRGPPTILYDSFNDQSIERARSRYDLPPVFAFYPAKTWPHKNHCRLLEALAALRDENGVVLPLMCTGKRSPAAWGEIQQTMDRLELHDQVSFLGFVDPEILRALYRLSQFVVIPSLFEGGGFPVLEAWAENTPVICADVTSLPEKADDAALLFDPESVPEIRDTLYRIHTDETTRSELRERGRCRVNQFDWTTTGRTYRALYRKVTGLPVSEADKRLLSPIPQDEDGLDLRS